MELVVFLFIVLAWTSGALLGWAIRGIMERHIRSKNIEEDKPIEKDPPFWIH